MSMVVDATGMAKMGSCRTLAEIIEARSTSNETWLLFPDDPGTSDAARRISYRQIACKAAAFATGLVRLGAHRKLSPVVLIFDNSESFFVSFFGCVLAGVIPITRSPPWLHPGFQTEVETIVSQSEAGLMVCDDAYASAVPPACAAKIPCMSTSELFGLGSHGDVLAPLQHSADVPLFIQYSSGSTRKPLGVAVSNSAALANIEAIGKALRVSKDDVVVSWLPVSHDMGLIGASLFSFCWGLPLVLLSPLDFVSKPGRWLWALSRFRGTLSPAPNFAYALCASSKRVPERSLDGLDLSTWRAALNGSEAVLADTLAAFGARFAPYGFCHEAMCPAYGLAENVLACTLTDPAESPRTDTVDRNGLEANCVAAESYPGEGERTLTLVSSGPPVLGTEVRIVDESNKPLGERRVGEVQFRGTSQTMGYWKRPRATDALRTNDGWSRTGDVGYLASGYLYVVGRIKAIVKRAGRQYDAGEMAHIAGQVKGVRQGCVVVFGDSHDQLGTERVIVLGEIQDDAESLPNTAAAIGQAILGIFGFRPDEVHLLERGALPKSSSGKIRREQCLVFYRNGSFAEQSRFSTHQRVLRARAES
jgi:fatty-acyl-CoA synthase